MPVRPGQRRRTDVISESLEKVPKAGQVDSPVIPRGNDDPQFSANDLERTLTGKTLSVVRSAGWPPAPWPGAFPFPQVLGPAARPLDRRIVRAERLCDQGGGVGAWRLPAAQYLAYMSGRITGPVRDLPDTHRPGTAEPREQVHQVAGRTRWQVRLGAFFTRHLTPDNGAAVLGTVLLAANSFRHLRRGEISPVLTGHRRVRRCSLANSRRAAHGWDGGTAVRPTADIDLTALPRSPGRGRGGR
jgi:hypothetical protein